MEILNIGGKKVATGLEWEIIPQEPGQKLDKLMREAAKNNGCSYGMYFIFEEIVSAAFSTKKFNEFSGALLLASAHQDFLKEVDRSDPTFRKDWIYVDKDTDGQLFWLAVVKDGIPTPGFDTITTDFTEIQEKISDLLRVDTFTVYSPLSETQSFFYERGLTTPIVHKNFEELTGSVDLKKLKKVAKFKKLVGIPPEVMIVGFVFLALVAGYFAYDAWAADQKKKKAIAARAKAANMAKTKEEELYKSAVSKYYRDFYAERQKAFMKLVPVVNNDSATTIDTWSKIFNFQIPTNGWDTTSIKCSIVEGNADNEKLLCSKTLAKGKNTNNLMLLEGEPTAFLKTPVASTAQADFKSPITYKNNHIASYEFLTLDTFAVDFVSSMQNLNYSGTKFNIPKPTEEITFTPPKIPLKKEEVDAKKVAPTPKPLKIGYAKGLFVLTGDNFKDFVEMAQMLDWKSMSIANADFTFSKGQYSDPKWEMRVDYLIKTQPDKLEPEPISGYTPEKLKIEAPVLP